MIKDNDRVTIKVQMALNNRLYENGVISRNMHTQTNELLTKHLSEIMHGHIN